MPVVAMGKLSARAECLSAPQSSGDQVRLKAACTLFQNSKNPFRAPCCSHGVASGVETLRNTARSLKSTNVPFVSNTKMLMSPYRWICHS